MRCLDLSRYAANTLLCVLRSTPEYNGCVFEEALVHMSNNSNHTSVYSEYAVETSGSLMKVTAVAHYAIRRADHLLIAAATEKLPSPHTHLVSHGVPTVRETAIRTTRTFT